MLRNIGRRHTAQDIVEAFQLAQRLGFDNINADLIVGLPGDDLPGFQKSLEGVLALGASNVTVHSLALKRSARINAPGGDLSLHAKSGETAAMMDYSIERLTQDASSPITFTGRPAWLATWKTPAGPSQAPFAVTTSIPWMSPTRSSPAVRELSPS